jgi:hypothetical protein
MDKRPALMNLFAIWSIARLLRKNQKMLIVVGTDGALIQESRSSTLRAREFDWGSPTLLWLYACPSLLIRN